MTARNDEASPCLGASQAPGRAGWGGLLAVSHHHCGDKYSPAAGVLPYPPTRL